MKNNKWILLAEDNINIAELTLIALGADKLGCTVVVARDGLEAMDCLFCRGEFQARNDGPPVVAVLDVKMPKMDGLEVLRQMKSDERLKSVPVVMFTSSRQESDIIRSYRLGANAYVVKPVDFHEFSKTIRLVGEFWTMINEPLPEYGPGIPNQPPQLADAV